MNRSGFFFFAIIIAFCIIGGWYTANINPHAFIPLIAFGINLSISVFVVIRDKTNKLYRTFALWNFILAFDNLLMYGLYLAQNPDSARLWTQITGFGYYFLPATSFHFVLVFTKSRSQLKKLILAGAYVLAFLFTILSLIPPFYNEYVKESPYKYSPEGSFLYTASMLVLLVICSLGILQIVYAYRKARSAHQRNQYGFLLFAGLIALVIGSTNYLLSYEIDIYPISSIAFAFYGLILAYAIIKHRFLDIDVIVKKSIVYTSLTAMIVAGYAGLMVIANTILNIASPTTSIPLNAAYIIAVAFLLQPLRHKIQEFVDKKFFRDRYNYRKTLEEFSSDIVKTIGIEELSLSLINVVSETMKVRNAKLVTYDSDTNSFKLIAEKTFGSSVAFKNNDFTKDRRYQRIISHIKNNPGVIDKENIIAKYEEKSRFEEAEKLDKFISDLDSLEAQLVIPVSLKGEIKGLFLLGDKLSELGFSDQDIELLRIILNQTAVAIENSELYDRTLAIKRYYDDIVKSMTSGMLTLDNKGKIVTLNQAGERILDIKMDDISGSQVDDIFTENHEFLEAIANMMNDSKLKNTEYWEYELSFRNKVEKKLAVTASILKNQKNEEVGIVILFNDITEKRELEKQLERSKRLAYMGEMAANIAHEIKNPIGSIRLFVDALARDFSNPTAQKNFVEVIPQEVESIDRMVRDLLFLARPPDLHMIELDTREIVSIIHTFCTEDAAVKNIDFNLVLPEYELIAWGDGEKLKQALRNIVLNAIEAVQKDNGIVQIKLSDMETKICIEVKDNGPGIEEEDIAKLFMPFYTTKHSGTGLGLAIANRIIEDHGGSIKVESDNADRTSFYIFIPKT